MLLRRYQLGLNDIALGLQRKGEAVRVFDRCRILDTSEPWRRPRFVARAAGGKCTLEPAAPSWVARALQIDLGRG